MKNGIETCIHSDIVMHFQWLSFSKDVCVCLYIYILYPFTAHQAVAITSFQKTRFSYPSFYPLIFPTLLNLYL